MTERQWLETDQVTWLLSFAELHTSYRKLRLFQLECARRLCETIPPVSTIHELLAGGFEVVEPGASLSLIARVGLAAERLAGTDAARLTRLITDSRTRGKFRHSVRDASRQAVASNLLHGVTATRPANWWRTEVQIDDPLEARQYAALEGRREQLCQEYIPVLRCIVGNPFRPVAFDPRWRTEHTVGIAAKMYDDRDFAAMPILADALEEAGCDVAAVLTHCREPGPHARGCWVVDGVLGKR